MADPDRDDQVVDGLGGPPLVARPRCQATMWSFHRLRVRPSDRASGGKVRSWRSDARRVTNWLASSRVVGLVDASDDLFGVPGVFDLAFRVSGSQQPEELGAAPVIEAFVGLGEEAANPIQRVGLPASVAEGLVLDPAAALIQFGAVDGTGHLEALAARYGSQRFAAPGDHRSGGSGRRRHR